MPKAWSRLVFTMARPGGIEPPTKSLEGSCSIQLSYERTGCVYTGKARLVKSWKGRGRFLLEPGLRTRYHTATAGVNIAPGYAG